jgi:hypothetical protein
VAVRIAMRVGFACAVLCLLSERAFAASEIPRAPLDELWESHMLTGNGALYYEGLLSEIPGHGSFEVAKGRPDTVWATEHGIRVQDFRETAFGGLLRKGGWRIKSGLLGRVEVGALTSAQPRIRPRDKYNRCESCRTG